MKIIHLDQNSPDWLLWRETGIGGSDSTAIAGDGFIDESELILVKLGLIKVEENDRMRRGTKLEPDARKLYEILMGHRAPPVCVIHDDYPWMKASLDGLTEDHKIVLEIKCPSEKAHKKALRGQFPNYYKAQLQHNMMVTGCDRLHYFSFTDNPAFDLRDRFALVEVEADKQYQRWLLAKELEFVQDMGGI